MQGLNSRYNPLVDHIRAYAAILIVYFHSASNGMGMTDDTYIETLNPFKALVLQGQTAVSLFMVLSGYIFTVSALGKGIDYWKFTLNRFLRIYPLMIAITALALYLHPDKAKLGDCLRTLFMFLKLPLADYSTLDIRPWSSTFWTIGTEFQFYLVFPFLLWLLNKTRRPETLLALLAATVLFKAAAVQFRDVSNLSYYTIGGRIDQFLIGMFLATQASRFEKPKVGLLALAIVLAMVGAVALNAGGGPHKNTWWQSILPAAEGVIWASFVAGYLSLRSVFPALPSKILAAIGATSFSMYLLHPAIFVMLEAFLPSGIKTFPEAVLLTTAISLPVVIAVSTMTYFLIERPFLKMRVKYLRDWSVGSTLPSPATLDRCRLIEDQRRA